MPTAKRVYINCVSFLEQWQKGICSCFTGNKKTLPQKVGVCGFPQKPFPFRGRVLLSGFLCSGLLHAIKQRLAHKIPALPEIQAQAYAILARIVFNVWLGLMALAAKSASGWK